MTRWWLPRCDIERSYHSAAFGMTYDWCFGEFLYARFPKRAVEFRQIVSEDGDLIDLRAVLISMRLVI